MRGLQFLKIVEKAKSMVIPFFSLILLLSPMGAYAFPEFQKWSQTHSKMNVDCSMCHTHPDGPEGKKPGQIDSLSEEGLTKLDLARAATQKGVHAENPILNEFGNHIVFTLGLDKIYELRETPEKMAEALGKESDLDQDGISDGEEYADGTHPLSNQSGHPGKLFFGNLKKNWFLVTIMVLVGIFAVIGFKNILRYFEEKGEDHSSLKK